MNDRSRFFLSLIGGLILLVTTIVILLIWQGLGAGSEGNDEAIVDPVEWTRCRNMGGTVMLEANPDPKIRTFCLARDGYTILPIVGMDSVDNGAVYGEPLPIPPR